MAQGQIIIRRKRPSSTTIQDSIIWDESLSPMARFSLIAMLSMRQGWDYSVRGMAAMIHVSKDTMSKYIRELEDAGYLNRIQRNGQNGKFGKATYILTDTPWEFGASEPCPNNYDTAAPCPNLSAPETSAPEKSPQQIVEIKEQKREEKKDHPLPPQGDAVPGGEPKPKRKRAPKSIPKWNPERFEAFWAYYPRHEDRMGAVAEWDKLKPPDDLIDQMARALARQVGTDEWARGIGIPYACRWLRKRRWEDVPMERPDPGLRPRRVVEREEVPTW